MPSVFISYAREDLKRIRKLQQGLFKNGVSVWRDEDNLRGGQNWPEALGKAIDETQFFLLAWSKYAADSEPVKNEWNTAIALNKTIIPCLLDRTQLPHSLAAKQWIDAQDLDKAVIALTNSMQGKDFSKGSIGYRGPSKSLIEKWQIWVVLAVLLLIAIALAVSIPNNIGPQKPSPHAEKGLSENPPMDQALQGTIYDGKAPLQGVQVWLSGFGRETVTNEQGHFSFQVQAAKHSSIEINAYKSGYRLHREFATLGTSNLRFQMTKEHQ